MKSQKIKLTNLLEDGVCGGTSSGGEKSDGSKRLHGDFVECDK